MSAKTISVTWKATTNGEIQSASEEILTDEIKVINKTQADIKFIPETGVFTIYNRGDHKATVEKEMELQLPKMNVKTEMPEVKPAKPTYTKEMHERGDNPKFGSRVQLSFGEGIVISTPDVDGFLCVTVSGKLHLVSAEQIKPIPTIEDEMNKILSNHYDAGGMDEDLIKKFLDKFNITRKGD